MTKKEYVLYVNGKIVPVKKEIYDAYYKELNHERYLNRKDRKNGLIYYNQFDTPESNFEESIGDKTFDVSQVVETKVLMEKLYDALNSLSDEERELVIELFFEEKTLIDSAKRRDISDVAVLKRRNRILKKLKKILENEKIF
ncbi:MAG: sigma-70 family RNA polymerase sigma factor [Peptoniphilaceae bacterium]